MKTITTLEQDDYYRYSTITRTGVLSKNQNRGSTNSRRTDSTRKWASRDTGLYGERAFRLFTSTPGSATVEFFYCLVSF